jgi:hypothetical protein
VFFAEIRIGFMFYAFGVLIIILGLLLAPTVQRLWDMSRSPILAWVVLLVALSAPVYVATTVLLPGDPVSTAQVTAVQDVVQLDIPPGHSLMVTAELSDDEELGKTSYAIRLKGEGWAESISGTIKRSGGGDDEINLISDETIGESGKRRSGAVGEDLQERFDFPSSGPAELTVTNYQGGAAEALALEVVKGPPPLYILWGMVFFVAIAGLYVELRKGCDKFAGDMAAMACYAALMPQAGITPLDNLRGIAFAGLGAILLGQGGVNAFAWVAHKYLNSMRAAKEEAPVPPPAHRRR